MTLELLDLDGGERVRPNVSGDLPTLFRAGPQFRRTLTGYDRFQVDTYVQWAEEELATADRERLHLEARQLSTSAALADAQRLLGHSVGGGQFLEVSDRIGSMLAAAADEAEGLRAEAAACRSAAEADAGRLRARAAEALADAEVRARATLDTAAAEADATTTAALAAAAESERANRAVGAQAAAELAAARATGQRALGDADRTRQRAGEEAAVALLRARDEVVRMLGTARAQRQRADDEAAARRRSQDDDAAARGAAVVAQVDAARTVAARLGAEIAELEHRRAALRAEVDRLADAARPRGIRLGPSRFPGRLGSRAPRTP